LKALNFILSLAIIFFAFLPYLSSYTTTIFLQQVKIKASACDMPKHLKNADSIKLIEQLANLDLVFLYEFHPIL